MNSRGAMRLVNALVMYNEKHPGLIQYRAGVATCRIRLPGMVCDRHPDQAVYLRPIPDDDTPWTYWIPNLVVEIIGRGSKKRDTVEKREEYLRVGIDEYWIIDPVKRILIVHHRAGDTWDVETVSETTLYRTFLLPGLEVRLGDLLGPVA